VVNSLKIVVANASHVRLPPTVTDALTCHALLTTKFPDTNKGERTNKTDPSKKEKKKEKEKKGNNNYILTRMNQCISGDVKQ
jgi:hypothetical protein